MTRIKRLVLMVLALLPAPAFAQNVCLQLEAQLGALQQSSGNTEREYQTLSAQYARDRAAYDAAVRQADAAGCIARGLFRRNVPASCSGVVAQLNSMEANLAQLSSRMASLTNPNRMNTERNNLLRSLAANNCGPQYAPYADQSNRLLDRIFGATDQYMPAQVTGYRTLCVRVCDGYYFPISYSVSANQFATDALMCQIRCPNQQVELYIHRNPGETIEQAATLSGQNYMSLPTAFDYREAYNPDCGCGTPLSTPQAVLASIGGDPQTVAALFAGETTRAAPTSSGPVSTASGPRIPLPVSRPEPSEDPETLANRSGGYSTVLVDGGLTTGQIAAVRQDDSIRLIGPSYYYAQ